MSSVIIAGNTSGTITVAAPAAAGTNTITMPAATGTMALTSDTSAVPSQTGNAGKLLTTNGSAASWGGVSDYTTFTNLTEKVTVAATAATGYNQPARHHCNPHADSYAAHADVFRGCVRRPAMTTTLQLEVSQR